MQTVRLPPQRVGAGETATFERGGIDRFMILAAGIGRAGDGAADEAESRIAGQFGAGAVEKRVLARARGADDENQHG